MLADEVKERGQVRRKQQCQPTRSWNVPPDEWVRDRR
jgi:hypothetical protein